MVGTVFFSPYIPRRNCVVKFIAAYIALKMTFKLRSQTWFKWLRSDASLATCEARCSQETSAVHEKASTTRPHCQQPKSVAHKKASTTRHCQQPKTAAHTKAIKMHVLTVSSRRQLPLAPIWHGATHTADDK